MIRQATPADMDALKAVITATGLFPPEAPDGMTAPHFGGHAPDEIWLTCDASDRPVAIAYCAPERMTEGTWNLYLIAVHPESQRNGLGTALVRHVEALVAARGAHLVLVETSGLAEFETTRAFYRRCGYAEEGLIRDFYRPGEDKVVFCKALRR